MLTVLAMFPRQLFRPAVPVSFACSLQKNHVVDGAPFDQLYAPWR